MAPPGRNAAGAGSERVVHAIGRGVGDHDRAGDIALPRIVTVLEEAQEGGPGHAIGAGAVAEAGLNLGDLVGLDVEQLGAVYERVLDYEPPPSTGHPLTRTRDVRKASGTFYTPRSVAAYLVRQTLARDPDNYDASMLGASLSLARNDVDNAITLLERMTTRYKGSAQAHYTLALAYMAKGDASEAQKNVNAAVTLKTNYDDALLLQAQLNIRRDESAAAVASLTQLIQRRPQLAPAYLLLGGAYSTNGTGIVEFDYSTGHEREVSEFPTPDELWNRLRSANGLTDETAANRLLIPDNLTTGKEPRYYQVDAINRTMEAVARGQKRILLVMATGTGKTYTTFQIIWRLWKAGAKKRILFLADRNVLVDQTMVNDFRPFGAAMAKLSTGSKTIQRGLFERSSAAKRRLPGPLSLRFVTVYTSPLSPPVVFSAKPSRYWNSVRTKLLSEVAFGAAALKDAPVPETLRVFSRSYSGRRLLIISRCWFFATQPLGGWRVRSRARFSLPASSTWQTRGLSGHAISIRSSLTKSSMPGILLRSIRAMIRGSRKD